jgi:hypothetical protein
MPLKGERHDLPPSLVEDTEAHNQHPSAKILRQLYFGPKTGPKTEADIDQLRPKSQR